MAVKLFFNHAFVSQIFTLQISRLVGGDKHFWSSEIRYALFATD